jgi:beta-1,4-mannooligosaccharide/beta-1,4-mannosyl-N-acetylglucosamine phosphorylase
VQHERRPALLATARQLPHRSKPRLPAPAKLYELTGDMPNVVFDCAALHQDDRIVAYYGAADTVVGIYLGHLSQTIALLKANSL